MTARVGPGGDRFDKPCPRQKPFVSMRAASAAFASMFVAAAIATTGAFVAPPHAADRTPDVRVLAATGQAALLGTGSKPSTAARAVAASTRAIVLRDCQHGELLRVHAAIREDRVALYREVSRARARRAGLSFERLRHPGARDRTRRSRSSAARPTASSFQCSRNRASRDSRPNRLYAELAAKTGRTPHWNFHKYVVDRSGTYVVSFDSRVTPEARDFVGLV